MDLPLYDLCEGVNDLPNGMANEKFGSGAHLHESHAPNILAAIVAERELFTGMRKPLKGDKTRCSVFGV